MVELEFDDADEIVGVVIEDDDFAAASSFRGPREGFLFKAGPRGLGYYRDAAPPERKKVVSFCSTSRSVDAVATVERVCRAVEAKPAKALAMLAEVAAAGGLSTETAPLFFRTIERFVGRASLAEDLVPPISRLLEILVAGSVLGRRDRETVVTWSLSCRTARTILRTDDTFEFAAAMKRVRAAIEALVPSGSQRAAARRDAILHCLRAAWPAYDAKPWAKTPVEVAVLAAAERRSLFAPPQQRRLDRFTTRVRDRQRGLATTKRTAIRAAESRHHPLRDVATHRIR